MRPAVVSTGSAARFAERVAARRQLSRRRTGWWAGGVLATGVVVWLLLVSPVLALDPAEVEVEGTGGVVEADEVRAVVAARGGTPLPRLDTVGLRREVLDVPGVRAAEVARVWPTGLRITVVAREPVAAVPDGSGVALLDVEGVKVGRADAAPDGLPEVDVPLDDAGARALTAVLLVLEQLPPELGDEVVEASAASQDTVRLVLADGTRVEWGSSDRGALKARVLLTLRANDEQGAVTVFDVSAPELPITTS